MYRPCVTALMIILSRHRGEKNMRAHDTIVSLSLLVMLIRAKLTFYPSVRHRTFQKLFFFCSSLFLRTSGANKIRLLATDAPRHG